MSDSDDDTFTYEITIPETTALIQITKEQIVDEIEDRLERPLSKEEKDRVWDDFRHSDDFYDIFAELFREQGIPCMGASGLSYRQYFEPDVETAIQSTIDEIFSHCWNDFFGNSLDTIAEEIKESAAEETKEEEKATEESKAEEPPHVAPAIEVAAEEPPAVAPAIEAAVEEPITWANVESQSQIRIQDENVKNGLARCANEKKHKSIDKWRAHYVNTHILGSAVVLPDGKSKEDLVKQISAYLG
jgi:hypothetical protein